MEAATIHAAGVRGSVISSPPEAGWGVGFRLAGESAARLGEALDPMAQILEVRLFDAQLQHFFDDCREVCQGTNRAQRRSSGSTQDPARRGQNQCVFDGSQGHAALLELGGPETVRWADGSRGSRRLAVSAEHLLDIFVPADGLLFHGVHLSLAGPAAKDAVEE